MAHSSTTPYEQNRTLPWLITGQIQKLIDTKQEGNEKSKKLYHATVSLSTAFQRR
jgi:hypothetical protein